LNERSHSGGGGRAPSVVATVVLPVAILLTVIAIVVGLVFGGVLQGHSARVGPEAPTSTVSTIVIEP
jgi:hypothetical protein